MCYTATLHSVTLTERGAHFPSEAKCDMQWVLSLTPQLYDPSRRHTAELGSDTCLQSLGACYINRVGGTLCFRCNDTRVTRQRLVGVMYLP